MHWLLYSYLDSVGQRYGNEPLSKREELIKARLGLLALAERSRNVSLACKLAGISRSYYYKMKKSLDAHGPEGLAPREPGRPRMPNQTPAELEQLILEMTEKNPACGYSTISAQLCLGGVKVTPSAVRYVWQRHGLTRYQHRLRWLKQRLIAGVSDDPASPSNTLPSNTFS